MDFFNQDILSTQQFDKEGIEKVIKVAQRMEPFATKKKTSDLLSGKMLAALFYEPSTRTRLSTETAMLRLGGEVIGAVGVEYSSLRKGETLYDTGKMVSSYADIIAIRHPVPNSAEELARGADVPVINCGDGPHQHPTQALLDLYTIYKEKGAIDGVTLAMLGDLKFCRPAHSLCYLLPHYSVKLILVSPAELKMPEEIKGHLKEKGIYFEETQNLEEALKKADVVYSTRIQQERFEDKSEYERLKGTYVLSRELIERCNSKAMLLHPLPRVDEIHPDTDALPGAAYFRQAANGVAVRMALLALLLGKVKEA